MRFSTVFAALPFVGLAFAQQNFVVKVGDNSGLTFTPPSININDGDSVSFQFLSKNHSVTQSSFAKPCEILTNPDGSAGIDSGFQPVDATATDVQTFTFTVNNASAPLWFFCAQTTPADHCAAGMVFAINPTADKTFEAFQAAAKAGGATNTTASSAAPGASGTAGATSASVTATGTTGATASPSASPNDSGAGSLKAKDVAALLVAGVAVVAGSLL